MSMGSLWNETDSAGEALSMVCAASLHPDGYYGQGLGQGPRIAAWLNSNPRNYDWLSTHETTDTHPLSYGVSALFIYYLISQLKFPDLTSLIVTFPTRHFPQKPNISQTTRISWMTLERLLSAISQRVQKITLLQAIIHSPYLRVRSEALPSPWLATRRPLPRWSDRVS